MLRVVPSSAFFHPGELISLKISADEPLDAEIYATIFHLSEKVAVWTAHLQGPDVCVEGYLSSEARRGYLVQVQAGELSAFTAFDVLDRWTDAPRYGFLYDFGSNRDAEDIRATSDHLLALHVNGLQFYDWQYRHDMLLPPQSEFTDPLGRRLSLATVRALIEAAHARGMAAMPYTAIYGASPGFAAAHSDWQLFDENHEPIDFANGFLKIMNPSSEWQRHFVQECRRVLDALPFDGIHVDQYGEPTSGFDANGTAVDLAAGFADTLKALRAAIGSDKALVFNLVHNWPAETIAGSPLDFWYSELWPPETNFKRLAQTIRDNRRLNDRPVVLAVYIPPEWENTVIAAHSTILAAGGTHIAHGDYGRYLSDPYFPKAGYPSPVLAERLRQLADFAVAYEEALVFAEDVTDDWIDQIRVNGQPADAGQVMVRTKGKRLFVNILNNVGRWDAKLSAPQALTGLHITMPQDGLQRRWLASPAAPLPQNYLEGDLPSISDWLLLCFEYSDGIPCPT